MTSGLHRCRYSVLMGHLPLRLLSEQQRDGDRETAISPATPIPQEEPCDVLLTRYLLCLFLLHIIGITHQKLFKGLKESTYVESSLNRMLGTEQGS